MQQLAACLVLLGSVVALYILIVALSSGSGATQFTQPPAATVDPHTVSHAPVMPEFDVVEPSSGKEDSGGEMHHSGAPENREMEFEVDINNPSTPFHGNTDAVVDKLSKVMDNPTVVQESKAKHESFTYILIYLFRLLSASCCRASLGARVYSFQGHTQTHPNGIAKVRIQ